ncbi:hypothetical protein BGP_5494 [Beggiatoa sp. PS]|nr:hypothetical protein BGP_5494 [Beggiatoa sp. PS]
MNILIVESENDQYFIEALAKKVSSENQVCRIDDYKYSSLDEKKLTTVITGALDRVRNISKLGIILDMDNSTPEKRIQLINKCLKNSFHERNYPVPCNLLTNIKEFITNPLDDYLNVKIACFFTNIDGEGELETVLKAIAFKPEPVFADCLYTGWKSCLEKNGKTIGKRGEPCDISEKELLKLWVDFYKRFDTLKRRDRNEKNTDWKGIMLGIENEKGKIKEARGKEIFDLQSDKLKELKSFLSMFD